MEQYAFVQHFPLTSPGNGVRIRCALEDLPTEIAKLDEEARKGRLGLSIQAILEMDPAQAPAAWKAVRTAAEVSGMDGKWKIRTHYQYTGSLMSPTFAPAAAAIDVDVDQHRATLTASISSAVDADLLPSVWWEGSGRTALQAALRAIKEVWYGDSGWGG